VQSDATTTAPAPTFEYSNDAPATNTATNTPIITQDEDDD
jgi:hypothetical protein